MVGAGTMDTTLEAITVVDDGEDELVSDDEDPEIRIAPQIPIFAGVGLSTEDFR